MERAYSRAYHDCQDEAERHSAESAQCQHEVHRAVAVLRAPSMAQPLNAIQVKHAIANKIAATKNVMMSRWSSRSPMPGLSRVMNGVRDVTGRRAR